jgi:hypothetical protein
VAAGNTYYVAVDGIDGGQSAFTLVVDGVCDGGDDDDTALDDDDATGDDDDVVDDDDSLPTGYDGPGWTIVHSRNQPRFSLVWASAADDVWAKDSSQLLWHWDGERWTQWDDVTRNITAFWGAAADDLWATMYGGVLHWDGVAWTGPTAIGSLTGAWQDVVGLAANDVWAVGNDGNAGHWDGVAWTEQVGNLPATADLRTVAPLPNGDLWAATGADTWFRTGTTWIQYNGPQDEFDELWASPSGEVFGALNSGLYRLDGGAFVYESSTGGSYVKELWGFSGTDLYATTSEGEVFHRGGAGTWSEVGPSAISSTVDLYDIHGAAPDALWVVGYFPSSSWSGEVWRGSGTSWSSIHDSPTANDVTEIHGVSGSEIYAIAGGDVLAYDGADWTVEQSGVPVANGLFACAPGEVWALTNDITQLWHRTPTGGWASESTGIASLNSDSWTAVWGSSCSDVWFFGLGSNDTVVTHWNGSAFTRQFLFNFPNGDGVHRLFGFGPSDIWGMTDSYAFVHFDGSIWSEVHDGNLTCCGGIWGAAADDVWASESDAGDLRYNDGSGWTPDYVVLDLYPDYGTSSIYTRGLWGRASDDIWAVGDDGDIARMFHYDGATWSESPSPTDGSRGTDDLEALWGSADGFWAVGEDGLFLFHP